jgi:hypothetical protein
MRVSSLSDERVIRLLARHFVPVWLSRDHYQLGAPAEAEREELLRIDRERAARKLPGGAVCVHVLAPDGALLATLPVQKAWKAENLVPFLEKVVAGHKFEARSAAAVKASTAAPRKPKPAAGAVLLSVFTRFDDRGPNRGVSHDRVELGRAEWSAFAPPAGARAGTTWEVPRKVSDRVLRYAYPPLPRWDARQSKVTRSALKATVTGAGPAEVRVRLEGKLELAYPVRGERAEGRVTATLVGALRYDPRARALTSFLLASEEAEYAWEWEGKPLARKIAVAVEAD